MSINEQIQRNGYAILSSVIDGDTLHKLLDECRYWYAESKVSGNVPRLNKDQPNVYNLQNKNKLFIDVVTGCGELNECLLYFLNDKYYAQIPSNKPNYILRAIGARSSSAALPLHIDSFIPYAGKYPLAMQVAIVLEDQTEENGCTVVVPGSHQSADYAMQGALSQAIALTPKAGDVVIWDSRIWHGTTDNVSGGTRWAIIATFCRWWVKQQFNITKNLPAHIFWQLTPEQKSILGYCSVPFDTEKDGIDIKQGYEIFN